MRMFILLLLHAVLIAEDTISIATFNIQIFGQTKISKSHVVDELAQIVRRYDLIAIQEIKDISGETPVKFLDAINESKDKQYKMLLSERSGLQEDDRFSQEQYAYYYNTDSIKSVDNGYLYDDVDDLFQREPFIVKFKVNNGNFDFVAITVHTRPGAALQEIDSLHKVIEWARLRYKYEDDFLIIGDLNADGKYAKPEDLDLLTIRNKQKYNWIIPDDADTNYSPSTEEAYDRIIITTGASINYAGKWGVGGISDGHVSDHFPVYAEFFTNKDSDGLIDDVSSSLIWQLKSLRKHDEDLYNKIIEESKKD